MPADTFTHDKHTLFDISYLPGPIALGGADAVEGVRLTVGGALQQCDTTPSQHQDYPSISRLETPISWFDCVIKLAMISSCGRFKLLNTATIHCHLKHVRVCP